MADSELPEIFRTREELINTHLSDDDIVEILDAMKRAARAGEWAAAKLLIEFKYGKNPDPPSTERTLEDLLWETPLGHVPGPDAI